MPEHETSTRRKRVMTYFIEATEKLIQEEGIDGLSIRKIAAEAGYNSATLYNYFEDLEHLILFASVGYLREYVFKLRRAIKPEYNALEVYRVIYRKFSEACFSFPELFHNLFFGRYSHKLGEVLSQYYELYPTELDDISPSVRSMLTQGNIYRRDMAYADALVEEGFVSREKKEQTVQLMVRTHQSFIYDAWMKGGRLDVEEHIEAFMKLFEYIMEQAK